MGKVGVRWEGSPESCADGLQTGARVSVAGPCRWEGSRGEQVGVYVASPGPPSLRDHPTAAFAPLSPGTGLLSLHGSWQILRVALGGYVTQLGDFLLPLLASRCLQLEAYVSGMSCLFSNMFLPKASQWEAYLPLTVLSGGGSGWAPRGTGDSSCCRCVGGMFKANVQPRSLQGP